MLYNLSNKYLIDEEGKYPFIPKVNSIDSNFYIKNQNLYTIPHRNMEYYTERNDYKVNYLNKIKNLKNNTDNYVNNYIKKKYIPINKQKIKIKNKKNYSNSFSQNNMINPYLEERIYNKNISSKKINNSNIDDIFPLTIKYKYNDFNNHFRNFIGEEKENGEKNVFNNKNNSNLNKIVNKSYSCKIYSSTKIIKRKKNNEDYINKIPIETNNCNFSRNNDLNIYLKNKIKKQKNRHSKEIIIPKINGRNIEHEKKYVYSCNSSKSLYNISSIGGSLLKKSLKLKSHYSPNKREHLFSFGSDLFYVGNNNSNRNRIKSTTKKKCLIKRNSTLKSGSSMKSQKRQISTKSSGTNTNSCYNNYNLNGSKEKNKNGFERNNKLEIQGINEYSILNNCNNFDNEIFNLNTTLQTLTDSKILNLANNYISEDDSLERYKRNIGIYNENNFK